MRIGNKIDIIKTYLCENWRSFLLVSSLTALASLLEIFGILAFLPIFAKSADIPLPDFIKSKIVGLSTLEILIIISTLFALKAAILTFISFIKAKIFSGYETKFIYSFFDAIVASKWSYFISKPVGEIINTALKECPAAALIYSHIIMLFATILQLAILIFFSLYISWQASLLGVVVGFLVLKIFDFMPKKLKKLGGEFQVSFKETSGLVNDFFSNIKPLKSMNVDRTLFDEIRPKLQDQALMRRDLSFIKTSTSILMEPIIVIFICFILYVSLEVIDMNFAQAFALIIIFYKIMSCWKLFNQSIMSISEYENFFWAIDQEISDAKENKEFNTGNIEKDLKDAVVFDNVSFEYIKGKKVLDNISFKAEKNTLTAIVGPSGCGKTTIIDIICKLYMPKKGNVYIDDVNLNDINTRYWRSQIGYVPQEFFMLHNSLRHNITLGDESYCDDDIYDALKKAGAINFVSQLEDGLDTIVGERGARFSGGQRQRISIARALLRRPQILILDEATTALDTDTEEAICKELKNLTQFTTVIAISHQLAILNVADNIIKLKSK